MIRDTILHPYFLAVAGTSISFAIIIGVIIQ